jgi:alpha-tubulin suppressor-like RCC1 family protein
MNQLNLIVRNSYLTKNLYIDFGTKKISKIFCNNQVMHSISDDGMVYSWGNDREKTGILGLGYTYNQATPLLNTNFANKKIVEISLSEKHAAAIDGKFYSRLIFYLLI